MLSETRIHIGKGQVLLHTLDTGAEMAVATVATPHQSPTKGSFLSCLDGCSLLVLCS